MEKVDPVGTATVFCEGDGVFRGGALQAIAVMVQAVTQWAVQCAKDAETPKTG